MKELVLAKAETLRNEAIIVKIDYDSFTASVKRVKFEGQVNDYEGEIKRLLDSGKLKLYGGHNKPTPPDFQAVWLAHDKDKGIMLLTEDNKIEIIANDDINSVFCRRRLAVPYARRTGNDVTLWEIIEKLMAKHKKGLESAEVRDDLLRETGVDIEFTRRDCYESKGNIENFYAVNLYGMAADKLKFSGGGCHMLRVEVNGGVVDELYLENTTHAVCYSAVRVGTDGEVDRIFRKVMVGDGIKKLTCEQGEPVPLGSGLDLVELDGFNNNRYDLSAFRNIKKYRCCWVYGTDTGIDLVLPDIEGASFDGCFHSVRINSLLPCTDGHGGLRIENVADIERSFKWVSGVNNLYISCNKLHDSVSFTKSSVRFEIHTKNFYRSCGTQVSLSNPVNDNQECSGTVYITVNDKILSDLRKAIVVGSGTVDSYNTHFVFSHETGGSIHRIEIWQGKDISAEANVYVEECLLLKGIDAKFEGVVDTESEFRFKFYKGLGELVKSTCPVYGAESYGDGCFASLPFEKTHICAPGEGLKRIGKHCFNGSSGIAYFVVPKSVREIGMSAFKGMNSGLDDLTTICVYRDSWAHKEWSKGKQLRLLVIDSLEDIPKETSEESETDFIAAFVQTPVWADKSKAFVAKLLSAGKEDLYEHIPEGIEVPLDVQEFFDDVSNSFERDIAKLEGININGERPVFGELLNPIHQNINEDEIPRTLLSAMTYNSVFGSNAELLKVSVLKRFKWIPKQLHGVTKWVGYPKYTKCRRNGIFIYLYNGKALYVGAAQCNNITQETFHKESRMAKSSLTFIEPAVEGRLRIKQERDGLSGDYTFKAEVFEEPLRDEVLAEFRDAMYKITYLGSDSGHNSGGAHERLTYMYDIVNDRILKFSSLSGIFGVYKGEVSREEFERTHMCMLTRQVEQEYLEDAEHGLLPVKANQAQVCFEARYAMSHPAFGLYTATPNLTQLIDFMSRSGLVKRLKNKAISEKHEVNHKGYGKSGFIRYRTLASKKDDYTETSFVYEINDGKTSAYFEAGFNIYNLIDGLDEHLCGNDVPQLPDRGYFDLLDSDECVSVTLCGHGELSIDLLSGKLVLTKWRGGKRGILFAFDSAKDAREFYKSYGFDLFDFKLQGFFDRTFYVAERGIELTKGPVEMYTEEHWRFINSVLAIGGKTSKDIKYSGKQRYEELYDGAVLKYARL